MDIKSLVGEFLPPNDFLARARGPLESHRNVAEQNGLDGDTSILIWAAWNLDIAVVAFRGYELAKPDGDENIFDSRYEAVEISAISGVLRSCVTALDLCGAFVGALATGQAPNPEERHLDIGDWTQARIEAEAPSQFAGWLTNLQNHGDWVLLQDLRAAVTHRTLRRHINIVIGGEAERGLSIYRDEEPLPIEELLPKLIRFSGAQFSDFLGVLDGTVA